MFFYSLLPRGELHKDLICNRCVKGLVVGFESLSAAWSIAVPLTLRCVVTTLLGSRGMEARVLLITMVSEIRTFIVKGLCQVPSFKVTVAAPRPLSLM